MKAKVALGVVAVLLVALVALRVAGFGTLHVILPIHSGGFPSDPNLIWCANGQHPPCPAPSGRDRIQQ